MPKPLYRYLRGYTIDPGFSTQLDTMGVNEMIYRIPWERLEPGPIGECIEVIDLDPTTNYIYDPVDLDDPEILSQHGVAANEGNAQFHQQFVYLVIMQTIWHFEKALGRKIIWRRKALWKDAKLIRPEQYVPRLRVYPHAIRDANAFYSSEKVALLFGYFDAGGKIHGANFPGGVVFTCLSPDIIAHETTHAILDSILPKYLENTNPDVAAFHEAFADIVALLQRFGNTQLVEHQLRQTRGRLDEYSVLGELATQFGEALQNGRGALRSAIGSFDKKTNRWKKITPDPAAYQSVFEPHHRGAILVATIFDAFMRLYNFRTKDLIRIATQGTGVLPQGDIHPDLVKRLAVEASEIALHLLAICIRALDYCPPFDITFGEYLRALITADVDLCPADENGYRVALIEAFRAWGIFPDRVNTLSIYSLKWGSELTHREEAALKLLSDFIRDEIKPLLKYSKHEEIFKGYAELQKRLHRFLLSPQKVARTQWRKRNLNEKVWKGFLSKLGISFDPPVLKYQDVPNSKSERFYLFKSIRLNVDSIRPAFRIGNDQRQLEQVVISLSQTLKGKTGTRYENFRFSGGCTIVLNLSDNELTDDYIIQKNIASEKRLQQQLDYQLRKACGGSAGVSMYDTDDGFNTISFEKLHFH